MTRHFSGPRLRAARKSAGLSPEQLAVNIGRSFYSVRERELGRVTPSVPMLIALADTLGCTVDDLLDEEPKAVTG